MLVARQQFSGFDLEEAYEVVGAVRAEAIADPQGVAPRSFVPETIVQEPSGYAGSRNRPALVAIAALHVVAIVALVKMDVLQIAPKRHEAVMIDLKPLQEAPPPQPQQKQEQAPPRVQTPIVAPPPIVSLPVAPPPVMTVPTPPPSAPVPAPAPAAPAAVIAAPVIPPDGSAANLGNPAPRYPVESRRAREEGTVRLRVQISADGAVQEISVAKTSGYDRLDKAALETVRRWKFRPGTQAGKPVEAIGFLSIPFILSH